MMYKIIDLPTAYHLAMTALKDGSIISDTNFIFFLIIKW